MWKRPFLTPPIASRDLRDRSDTNGDLAQTESAKIGDLNIMNLVILIDNAQMFFRNFGFRHVNATLGHFVVELAGPNAGQKIARFASAVEWLRSRLRPQVPETSIQARIQRPLEVCAAEVSFPPTTDCCAGRC
jgi:hypothetical protein